jgi:hypothetical protein
MKPETLLVTFVIALCLFLALAATVQKPSVELTSNSLGSTLTSTDYFGNTTTCTADVMPGGSVVSRCY